MRYVHVRGLFISGPQEVVIGPSVQTLNQMLMRATLGVIGNGKVANDRHART